ncbi:RHS repeat protein, partial [Salmonella enterica subsp. enterica serovar Poona]|nr:RHS repeat protein [Salmonella enterica subsp. enterica serovar Poona]
YLYDAEQPYTPVASVTGKGESRQVWYYHTDVTGTPQEVTAADGTLVWAGYIRGFGENAADISNSGAYFHQPLRLPGQYFDDETGLHYNLFRYYAPECGRFVSQDPIGLNGGINLYQYAPNPLSWIDPWGLAGSRLPRSNGYWDGSPGESNWHSNNPSVNAITGGEPISFSGGRPDFSPWSKGSITFNEGVLNGSQNDFTEVYKSIAKEMNITPTAAKNLLSEKGLTPHHLSVTEIILVPSDLHGNVPHIGSASDMRNSSKC